MKKSKRKVKAFSSKATWRVHVFFEDDNGDETFMGTIDVMNATQEVAQREALIEIWEPRLDAADCSPVVYSRWLRA